MGNQGLILWADPDILHYTMAESVSKIVTDPVVFHDSYFLRFILNAVVVTLAGQ